MFRQTIKNLVPSFFIEKYRDWKYYKCPICNAHLAHYLPLPSYYKEMADKYGYVHDFYGAETLNYESCTCYACYASDRDRLFALYFQKYFLNHPQKLNLIDFAPSQSLAIWLKKQTQINYRSADLYMEGVDDKVDITNMTLYKDGQFDIFICSHILEHVTEPDKALEELHRILPKGGWGIVMVPIIKGLEETQENPAHTTIEERWKYYGQDDHLRMFGRADFIRRIGKAGFKVLQLDINFFGEKVFQKAGISKTSVLYIAQKV